MKDSKAYGFDKNEILKKCFYCIMQKGFESVSMRDFSVASNLSTSSLYYWFKDKKELVLESTQLALMTIIEKSFLYVASNIKKTPSFFDDFTSVIIKYSETLRAVIQVATSPAYCNDLSEFTLNFELVYKKNKEYLSELLNIDEAVLKHIIDSWVSIVVNYVIWSDWKKLREELEYVFQCFNKQ